MSPFGGDVPPTAADAPACVVTTPDREPKFEAWRTRERSVAMRIGRIAAELKMRRRRLDAYQQSPDWPGKEPALRSELSGYDEFLLSLAPEAERAS